MDLYSYRADLLNHKGEFVSWRFVAKDDEQAAEIVAFKRREMAFFRGVFGTLLSIKQIGGRR